MNESETIEERNARVELDKAWETSFTRRSLIAIITYVVAAYFLYRIGVENHLASALVPTGGFLLSTLTLSSVKKMWMKRYGN